MKEWKWAKGQEFWNNPVKVEQQQKWMGKEQQQKPKWSMWFHQETIIRIIRIPKGEEREKGAETLFKEIIAENFPNPEWDLKVQVDKVNR